MKQLHFNVNIMSQKQKKKIAKRLYREWKNYKCFHLNRDDASQIVFSMLVTWCVRIQKAVLYNCTILFYKFVIAAIIKLKSNYIQDI